MNHILNRCFEKILVLTTNHKISEERRKRIIPRLEGIQYTFFYGVSYEDLDIQSYRDNGCNLQYPGQIGCSESFNKIYKYIFDNDIKNCLILEDDSIIGEDINLLESIYPQLPEDWQLFYLGHGHQDSQPSPNYSENLFRISRNDNYFPDATLAFAVTKECAKKLYDFNSKITWTADANIQIFFRTTDNVGYASIPKLILHEKKDSIVENFIV